MQAEAAPHVEGVQKKWGEQTAVLSTMRSNDCALRAVCDWAAALPLRPSSAVQCMWRVCQGQTWVPRCCCCCCVAPAPPQYHPEASPGPHDADICFQQFYEMMKAEALVKA